MSVDAFEGMVRGGEVGHVLVARSAGPGRFGPGRKDAIAEWVKTNCAMVEWRSQPGDAVKAAMPAPWGEVADLVERMFAGGGMALYDCSQ